MGAPRIAVVDYGMGNLFSVVRACDAVGLEGRLTTTADDLEAADGVILPGVGAFGDAMQELAARGLVESLRRLGDGTKPFLGICLGMQLMLSESFEFTRSEGLGLISGSVIQLDAPRDGAERLKVPQVGWNTIERPADGPDWRNTPLEGMTEGSPFYFVHSFHAVPTDRSVIASVTRYGNIEFCSSISKGALFGCQFHPERSGAQGLGMYRTFANLVKRTTR